MIKGIDFDFGGGRVLTVPPLSLGAIERFQDKLANPSGSDMIDMVLAALRRNYPEMTREDVAELIDAGNLADVSQALMGVSRLEPKAGETRPAGRQRR